MFRRCSRVPCKVCCFRFCHTRTMFIRRVTKIARKENIGTRKMRRKIHRIDDFNKKNSMPTNGNRRPQFFFYFYNGPFDGRTSRSHNPIVFYKRPRTALKRVTRVFYSFRPWAVTQKGGEGDRWIAFPLGPWLDL